MEKTTVECRRRNNSLPLENLVVTLANLQEKPKLPLNWPRVRNRKSYSILLEIVARQLKKESMSYQRLGYVYKNANRGTLPL